MSNIKQYQIYDQLSSKIACVKNGTKLLYCNIKQLYVLYGCLRQLLF